MLFMKHKHRSSLCQSTLEQLKFMYAKEYIFDYFNLKHKFCITTLEVLLAPYLHFSIIDYTVLGIV